MKPGRPSSVTILSLVVLIFLVWQSFGIIQVFQQWQTLTSVLYVSPLYLLLRELIWALCALWNFWSLWRGYFYAPRFFLGSYLVYILGQWLEWLFIINKANRSLSFIVLNGIFLVVLIVLWIIFSLPGVKQFFGGKHVGKT